MHSPLIIVESDNKSRGQACYGYFRENSFLVIVIKKRIEKVLIVRTDTECEFEFSNSLHSDEATLLDKQIPLFVTVAAYMCFNLPQRFLD